MLVKVGWVSRQMFDYLFNVPFYKCLWDFDKLCSSFVSYVSQASKNSDKDTLFVRLYGKLYIFDNFYPYLDTHSSK